MRCAFLSDLDGTLVHALRALPDEQAPAAVIVEHYEGRPITVSHEQTIGALADLSVRAHFVPATTRSVAQLQRITPIWERVADGWVICANGATILHGGEQDVDWSRTIERRAGGAAPVDQVRDVLEREFGDPAGVRWLGEWRPCDSHFVYAVCDPETTPPGIEEQASRAVEPLGWVAVKHGRKLYVLPRHLTKRAAAEHLIERLEIERVLAAGDSLLDLELLELADRAWVPVGSELERAGALPAGAHQTVQPHIGSGREIAFDALDDVTRFAVS